MDRSVAARELEKSLKTAMTRFRKDKNLKTFRAARTRAVNKYRKDIKT